jgi:hypothetical protein
MENYKYFQDHTENCSFPGLGQLVDETSLLLKSLGLAKYNVLSFDQVKEDLKRQTFLMVQDSLVYYTQIIETKLRPDLSIWKMCRYLNPITMRLDAALAGHGVRGQSGIRGGVGQRVFFNHEIPPEFLESVKQLQRFSNQELDDMTTEWRTYMDFCLATEVHYEDTISAHIMERSQLFWKNVRFRIPNLAKVARLAFILTPSSAAVERVFSMYKRHMTIQQAHEALTDYSQSGCMLDFNRSFPF